MAIKSTRELGYSFGGYSYGGMEGTVTDIGYDAYATAWRYLGAYTDCISSGSSYSRWSIKSSCPVGTRKLLWAAVSYLDFCHDVFHSSQ